MQKISNRKLALLSLFAAMVAVLEIYSIHLANFRFTFESLPIYLSALLFGPFSGAAVGGIGTLISQTITFGLMPTTLLWVLPYIIIGAVSGLYAKRKNFHFSSKDLRLFLLCTELTITGLNTLGLYIDSHVYGYYKPSIIFSTLLLRIVIAAVKGYLYGILLPPILEAIRKKLAMGKEGL